MTNEPAATRGAACADTPLRSSLRLLGISSMATRDLLADAVADWQGRGGIGVGFESAGGVDAARRVRDAEPFDVVVLAAEAIEQLAAAGRVLAGSTTALARSTVAMAVRRGAARPDIGSEDALRAAVLSARNVGCSSGPSGQALHRLFARWGLTEQIRSRIVQAPPGVAVGALLLRGDVDLGFQQLSELIHLNGIEVIGPMPPGLEIVTTFCGAVCAASAHADEARRLLDFIRSPAVDAARRRHGMQAA